MEVIKGIKPSSKKEIKNNSNAEKETDLESWVRSSIPVELQDIWGVGIIFREISKAKPFQDVWNFKVYTPKGFTEKALIRYSSQKIEELEYLSGTNVSLRSKEISFSRNISDEIFQIMREIKFHKSTNECPSKKMYNNSEHSFSVNASFYLRRKIMIEKLEEMLALLAQYKVQRE